jgi:hypothetical protein
VSILMLVSFVVAYVGYPSWNQANGKGSEPFPCQFSQCGCRTIEQCRTSCCCHTKQEKFVWALERGIDPDRVAVLTEQEKSQFAQQYAIEASAELCYSTPAGKSATKSCCSSHSPAATSPAATSHNADCRETAADGGLTLVLAITARKCSGTGLDWIEASFVAAPPPIAKFTIAPRQVPAVDDVEPSYSPPVAGRLLRPV